MSDLQALPGSSIFDTYQKLTEKPVIKKKMDEQGRIAALANSHNFKELQKVIDTWIETLGNIPIDSKTDTVESIGFRYLASRVTIEYLTDLKNLPERFAEMKRLEEIREQEDE